MTGAALSLRRTAVSLTPLPLEADSRALRIACTLAEAGFRSIVIEGRGSMRRSWGQPIEVRSAGRRPAVPRAGAILRRGRLHDFVTVLRAGHWGSVGEGVLYAGFRGYDWWRQVYRIAPRVPRADLYYLNSFEMYPAVAPAAARAGAPIVYDAHDFYRGIVPAAAQPAFDRHRLRPFLDRLEASVVAAAAAVITVSDGVAGLMEATFGRRPIVIRNCHDERNDRAVARDLRAVLGLNAADRLCVVVGNWKPGMAVNAAADALARLPDRFHIAFLGRGYEAIVAALPRDLCGGRLHFGHAAAPDEIVPMIRSADLGLVIYEPYSENYRYALPNGFFQVIAAGLPLVRARLPEIESAIGRFAIGACLERLDGAVLAQAILRCASDLAPLHAEAAALGNELRWSAEAVRLRRVIDAVLAGAGGTRPRSRAVDGAFTRREQGEPVNHVRDRGHRFA